MFTFAANIHQNVKEDIKDYIQNNRHQFRHAPFGENDAAPDPFTQFEKWFENAVKAEIGDPYALTLATADSHGIPSLRVVYMRDFSKKGLIFYTNYTSHKAHNLIENPNACANFYWEDLSRQVRLTGKVNKVDAEVSDAYFNSRPRGSKIGAWASHQSQVLENREELMERVVELEKRFANREVPRPEFWGGFILVPHSVEFWQGRDNRLHDRILYEKPEDGIWTLKRLSP